MSINAYRIATIAAIALLIAFAALTGIVLTQHTDTPAPSTSVSSFNDGYATAYQDMCQQGNAAACQWLKSN